ncbi:MAG TPA: hypothetical protein VET66_15500 [Steroidobacteraceae bacterium]|nr:hypothetical protein [Steroidobacteraceae bacterium]
MDRYARLLFLAFFIASVVWRVVKGLQAGAAARPQRGIPAPGGPALPDTAAVAPSPPAVDPLAGPGADPARLPAAAAAVAVWLAGNVLVWGALFGLPALAEVAELWRVLAGVLANLFLLQLAKAAAAAVRRRANPTAARGGSPFL